jgi:hypothetical protein
VPELAVPDLAFREAMRLGDEALESGRLDEALRHYWHAHAIVHEIPCLHIAVHRAMLPVAWRQRAARGMVSHLASVVILSAIARILPRRK